MHSSIEQLLTISTFPTDIQEYINKTFHISSTTSAPILISLSTFIFGFIINELIKSIAAYSRRKATKRIFFLSLSSLSKGIERQSKSFLLFSNQIGFRSTNQGYYSLGRIEIYQLITLKQMGYENIFNALFTGYENVLIKPLLCKRFHKRLKAFNKIWEAIEFVKTWQEKSFAEAETFMDKFNKSNLVREKAIQEFFKIIEPEIHGSQRNQVHAQSIKGTFLFRIDSIIYHWQQMPDKTNPFLIHRKIIIPLRILCRENSQVLDLVHQLTPFLMEATFAYSDMSKLNKLYKEYYLENSLYFKRHSKLISVSENILK